jgi:hypothetical protein
MAPPEKKRNPSKDPVKQQQRRPAEAERTDAENVAKRDGDPSQPGQLLENRTPDEKTITNHDEQERITNNEDERNAGDF